MDTSFNFSSKYSPKCFWQVLCTMDELLKFNLGWHILWVLREKTISCASLDQSGLKAIFHWNAHSEILFKSSFNYFADKSTSWTTEKMDVSSAKSLLIDDKFLRRSLIYIKKKRGPKMEPCRTPAIIGNHVEDWPLSNTLWFYYSESFLLIWNW